MDRITVKSPAKINIGLNIINKRDDGFHNLETIFYPLNIFDEITLERSDDFSFDSNDRKLRTEKNNLILRSREILEDHFDIRLNARIYLKKNIPIGAGLGGGSSNAASTLKALINLFGLNIDARHLSVLALQLGSDVPFFLNPVPSFAESRGEILTPLNFIPDRHILIVNPGIHISTKWAFGFVKPQRQSVSLKSLIAKTVINTDEIMSIAVNDFEKIVFEHFPEIKIIKEKMLENGADYSMMTGTGSTVWGMFDSEISLCGMEEYFRKMNYFTYYQKTI